MFSRMLSSCSIILNLSLLLWWICRWGNWSENLEKSRSVQFLPDGVLCSQVERVGRPPGRLLCLWTSQWGRRTFYDHLTKNILYLMNLRLFSKSSDVFWTLRRKGRTILPGQKAIGPRSSAQASILWKAERHVWHSCTYFPLFQNTKGCNLCTVLNDSHIFLQQIAHIILSCTIRLSSSPKWIPWIRSALMNQTPLQERKMAFFLK